MLLLIAVWGRFMQRFARFLLFPVMILIFSPPAFSQAGRGLPGSSEPTGISGTVLYQADNKPAQYVKVELRTSSGQLIDTYMTGSDGKWSTPAIPTGQYVITIEVEGYKPVRQNEELLGYPPLLTYIALVALPGNKASTPAAAAGPVVSARELGLPQEAQDALHQGTEALFQKHTAAASLPFFQKVLVMAPDFYEAAYYQGVALMELGRKKEAEDAYKMAALLSDDKFPDADFALAALLTDQQQYADAEKLVRAGLQMAPDAWNGRVELARVLLATGRLADAELSAIEVRKAKPDFPRIYLLLANIHQKQGKNEAVLDDLNTYLKMFPNGAYAGQAKAMKEQTEKALGRSAAPAHQPL
jgi:Tfp pilus assembly protein PilF/5-hydroxyisourate hydrolase-like protein (transthyretin family)